MPWTCSANSSPHSRYARSTTSVSLLLLKGCPFARSSSRSEAKSYASPLKTTATASRIIGWSPDSRSRMASLRCPSAAGPSKKNASASGPRWAIARAALRTPSASGAPAEHVDRLGGEAGEELHHHQVQHHLEGAGQPILGAPGAARPVVDHHLADARSLPGRVDGDEAVHLAVQLHVAEHVAPVRFQ